MEGQANLDPQDPLLLTTHLVMDMIEAAIKLLVAARPPEDRAEAATWFRDIARLHDQILATRNEVGAMMGLPPLERPSILGDDA